MKMKRDDSASMRFINLPLALFMSHPPMKPLKRKIVDDGNNGEPCKKQKLANPAGTQSLQQPSQNPQANQPGTEKELQQPRRRIRKLVPPRPWPINPAADNPTGPRSAKEGKNYISLTRKTPIGAYMRRCKALFLDDGYVHNVSSPYIAFMYCSYASIHLSAMGAAIPGLMQLTCSLPGILPYPRNEITMEVVTGTVEVQDEILPDSLDEDVVYNTRSKSTLKVTFTVGKEGGTSRKRRGGRGNNASNNAITETRILEEPEQEEERPDML